MQENSEKLSPEELHEKMSKIAKANFEKRRRAGYERWLKKKHKEMEKRKKKEEEEKKLEKSEETVKKEERIAPETLDVIPMNDKIVENKPIEAVPVQKQEEPVPAEENSVTKEETDVSGDFTETAVSNEEIQAGKKKRGFRKFLKRVKDALVES